jgi:glycosyltransferase involved in cell wall biosynthesis
MDETPRHILLVSPCMGSYGGLEAFVLAVASEINSTPYFSVEVILKKAGSFSLCDDLRDAISNSGVNVSFCPRFSILLLSAILRADLVHLQNLCPDVAGLARLARKPLLITVHARKRIGASIHQRLWSATLHLASQRFYISEFVRRTWERTFDPWPHSHVVHSICKLSSLSPLPVHLRRGFVFVSRWIENKGLDILLEAYAQSGLDPEQWPLYLLGDGPLRPRIQSRLRELGLDKFVTMPGFVNESEKADFIRCSRFAVIPPNTSEDFGLVPIEARRLGLPCLITRDGGLPEAAGKHSLICEPGDIQGLKKLLVRAASMSDRDYTMLASAAHDSLQEEIVPPSYYRVVYRAMIQRSFYAF